MRELEKKIYEAALENKELRDRLREKSLSGSYDATTLQGVAVQRVDDLQRQMKEIQNEHHDDLLQFKGKVTTLEFEVKNKNSQVEVLGSKLKKTEQELEIARNRLQGYEVSYRLCSTY